MIKPFHLNHVAADSLIGNNLRKACLVGAAMFVSACATTPQPPQPENVDPQVLAQQEKRKALDAIADARKLEWDKAMAEWEKHEPERRAAEQQQRTEIIRKRQAAQESARAAFASASSRVKNIGDTICTANNRLGHVEQISGDKIKVSILGDAAYDRMRYGIDEPYGPFNLDMANQTTVTNGKSTRDVFPINDKYFLFHPGRPVTFIDARDLRWEWKSDWAQCSYKFTI